MFEERPLAANLSEEIKMFLLRIEPLIVLYIRSIHKMKENKNYKNDEEANGSPKTVAVTVADNGIRETYMMCEKVINPNKTEKTANALVFFDTGSDFNCVTESMADKLKLKQTSPSMGMLITEMVGTRNESRDNFRSTKLVENVKNIQAYVGDSGGKQ
ncbi:Uroporphyrinogen-III C-methyltransferase [Dirofilaria immitis]